MPLFKKKIVFDHFYPLKVWITTILVGTCLHVLTLIKGQTDGAVSGINNTFLVELILGVEYSILTLSVCYIVYFLLIRTSIQCLQIKTIIAFTGMMCCTLTLMHKFNFSPAQFSDRAYAALVASYCLPLAVSCFLIRIRVFSF